MTQYNSIDNFLPSPLPFPAVEKRPIQPLLDALDLILATSITAPLRSPPFKFEVSDHAACHNAALLERFGYDLDKLIAAYPNTTSSFGSEFCRPDCLHPLLCCHDLWPFIRQQLEYGAHMFLTAPPVIGLL